jgi:hypothetical protein
VRHVCADHPRTEFVLAIQRGDEAASRIDSMDNLSTRDRADEFRFLLNVMEEHSHLGLDDKWAGKLREILLQRISETEDEGSSCCPAAPMRFPSNRGLAP